MQPIKTAEEEKVSFAGSAAIALALGILCGLADALAICMPRFSTDRVDYIPPRLWIVAPLIWVGYLLIVTGALSLLRRPCLIVPLLVLAGPGFLGVARLIVATRLPGMTVTRVVALSGWLLGVAAISLLLYRRPRRVCALVPPRWLTVGMISLLAGALVAFPFMDRARLPKAEAPASGSKQPNVILIFLDTMRADALQFAPHLARFAAGGRNYEKAYAPFPWTLPSHLSDMSGEGAESLLIDFEHQSYAGNHRMLAEIFREHGYRTAAVLANPYLNASTGMERGFESFESSPADLDLCRTVFGLFIKAVPNARVPLCRLDGDDVTGRAIELLQSTHAPLFLALNYFDTHLPYYVPAKWRPAGYEAFQPLVEYPAVDGAVGQGGHVPPGLQHHLLTNYAVSVRFLDSALGRLFAAIDASPEGANTIVVVAGDHGEQFGEHDLLQHGNSVYGQVLHVPLILRGPGIAPARITEPVSTTDLYGTLLLLANVGHPRDPALVMPGGQTRPVLSLYRAPSGLPRSSGRQRIDAGSVVLGSYHFIRYATGAEELFDLARDPEETVNRINDPTLASVRARMAVALRPLLVRNTDDSHARLHSLGYLE